MGKSWVFWLLRFEWKVQGAPMSPEEVSWVPHYQMAHWVLFTLVDSLSLICPGLASSHIRFCQYQCWLYLGEETCYLWVRKITSTFYSQKQYGNYFKISIQKCWWIDNSGLLNARFASSEAESQTLTPPSEAINYEHIIQCPPSWGKQHASQMRIWW